MAKKKNKIDKLKDGGKKKQNTKAEAEAPNPSSAPASERRLPEIKQKAAKQGKSPALPSGKPAKILRGAALAHAQKEYVHRWNPDSEVHLVDMARLGGLTRTGVSIARVPPGKQSFIAHAHHCEEEWVYVLMGEAVALIGETEERVGAGDFIAYPAPQAVHHLCNVGDTDLVYLMGGENAEFEIIDYPTVNKRVMRVGEKRTAYPLGDGEALSVTKPKKVKS